MKKSRLVSKLEQESSSYNNIFKLRLLRSLGMRDVFRRAYQQKTLSGLMNTQMLGEIQLAETEAIWIN